MGSIATDLALLAAVVAIGATALAVRHEIWRHSAQRAARIAFASSTAFLGLAVLALGRALWTVDPAWAYVARHSSEQTPLAYRVAGIWGGMEGSLLFWAFVVSCTFTFAVIITRPRRGNQILAITGVGGVTTAVFLFVGRTWASPFQKLDVPTGSGDGLLAVLQHPAMVYHPPILYVGLALTGVPFALTLLALGQKRLDEQWRTSVLAWLRTGWLVLAIGIVTGSQWAYAELGWGGFWAWDPVENSSLLPWLAVTVAIHLLIEPKGRFALTGAAAIVAAFGLMVCGVYVTRSGNTGSIHAFSESPQVGRPLLVFALVTLVIGIGALVRGRARSSDRPAAIRWNVLGLQAMLGAIAVAAIALGTFWPVIDGLVLSNVGTRTLVRPDYYHRALAPVATLALVAMALGPAVLTRGARSPAMVVRRMVLPASAGAIAAIAVAVAAVGSTDWLTVSRLAVAAGAGAAIGGSVGYALGAAGPGRRRRTVGISLAHCGFALVILGAVASSGGHDDTVRINVGQTVALAPTDETDDRQLTFVELQAGRTGRYEFVAGIVTLQDGAQQTFRPELRAYERQRIPTAEAVIQGSIRGDTIVVLESVAEDLGSATVTVRTRPLLPWVWLGATLVVAGGFVTLAGRRPASPTAPGATPDRVATTAQR